MKKNPSQNISQLLSQAFREKALREALKIMQRNRVLERLVELAWGIIANAGGGDWRGESRRWRKAAKRWGKAYHRSQRVKSKEKP